MILIDKSFPDELITCPHTRGDDPSLFRYIILSNTCPHTRGMILFAKRKSWLALLVPIRVGMIPPVTVKLSPFQLVPIRVGMILSDLQRLRVIWACPHTRGDDPLMGHFC